MGYYSRKRYSRDGEWLGLILSIILVIAIILGSNACTSSIWNNGKCPDCSVRYELRGASKGLKYYSCPECGQEVTRY